MTDVANWLDVRVLYTLVLVVLALLALLVGLALMRTNWRQNVARDQVERALTREVSHVGVMSGDALISRTEKASPFASVLERAAVLGIKWGDGRFGDVLLADEDRRLLDMSSYPSYGTARALFLFARGALSLGLPMLALILLPSITLGSSVLLGYIVYGILGFGLGWMLPKWVVLRRFRRRKQTVVDELPLLIDLLRLLQGVGLSVDQSLHVIQNEFQDVLPVLGHEIRISVEQYSRGRTRMQSMARMINGFENEDLEVICRLIAQVDEHGGAVQDPLMRFSDRLRERRRMDLKEKIGKLTVKMTGVMVVTLLPALLVVTAGSGFIAVLRGLTQIGGA